MRSFKLLSLNCQKNRHPNLKNFLTKAIREKKYDFLILQEATSEILQYFKNQSTYHIITPRQGRQQSLLSIVYNTKKVDFISQKFQLWPHYISDENNKTLPYISYGILLGIFKKDKETIRIGSQHLPPGLNPKKRKGCLQKIQKLLQKEKTDHTLFGGDCNFGIPGEIQSSIKLFTPDYNIITQHLPPTLNARYTETTPNLTNQINRILKKLKIYIQLKTDHLYIDSNTAKNTNIQTKVLKDRVSDHSPIEVQINELS